MKLLFEPDAPVQILPETLQETELLASDAVSAKLNFRLMSALPNRDCWCLCSGKETFSIRPDSREIVFPADLGPEAFCYALRVASDGILLDRGSIPLHCAAVIAAGRQVFLFAEPGGGKSYFADMLCEIFQGAVLIGDDHVVVGGCITGNRVRRLRGAKREMLGYARNEGSVMQQIPAKKSVLCLAVHVRGVRLYRRYSGGGNLSAVRPAESIFCKIRCFRENDIRSMRYSVVPKKNSIR